MAFEIFSWVSVDGIWQWHDIKRFSTFVSCSGHIPSYITSLTGIRDADVASAPSFLHVAELFLSDVVKVFGDYTVDGITPVIILVAHNGVRFDMPFFFSQCMKYSVSVEELLHMPDVFVLDTMVAARKIRASPDGSESSRSFVASQSCKLGDLFYAVSGRILIRAHSAAGDCEAVRLLCTQECVLALVPKIWKTIKSVFDKVVADVNVKAPEWTELMVSEDEEEGGANDDDDEMADEAAVGDGDGVEDEVVVGDGDGWTFNFGPSERASIFAQTPVPDFGPNRTRSYLDPFTSFCQVFPNAMRKEVLVRTNAYALQKHALGVVIRCLKWWVRHQQWSRTHEGEGPGRFRTFAETLPSRPQVLKMQDLYRFLAVLLRHGFNSSETIREWWSVDTSLPEISDIMPRDLFLFMLQNLHFSDSLTLHLHQDDPLYKVSFLLDSFSSAWRDNWKSGRTLVVDEAMCRFGGRHGSTQFIKSKPDKKGFVCHTLASLDGHYVLGMYVYMGKRCTTSRTDASGHAVEDQSIPMRVFDSLLPMINDGERHLLSIDNFYGSVPVGRRLAENGHFVVCMHFMISFFAYQLCRFRLCANVAAFLLPNSTPGVVQNGAPLPS